MGELLLLPCELGNPETVFETGGWPCSGSLSYLVQPTQLPINSCKEVIFALGFSVKLPRPAESILTWEFPHLTAQMGHFS